MSMERDQWLFYLDRAATELAADAAVTGLDAAVPTCPDWTVADLVGHQGMVHRWATAIVAGALPTTELDPETDAAIMPPESQAALPAWFQHGAARLLATLRSAPADLRAAVFLHAAPAPRLFWARRQAHETTIHRIDALSARLRRFPRAVEADIPVELAADGLDELLVGFVHRRSTRLRSHQPLTILVRPDDTPDAWTVVVSEQPPMVTRGEAGTPAADAVLTGSAAALYLGLWNRGEEVAQSGSVDALTLWRERVHITWS